jgi:hypothetical protein
VLAALASQLAVLDSLRAGPGSQPAAPGSQPAAPGGPPHSGPGPSAGRLSDLQSACLDAVLAALGAGLRPQPEAVRIAVRYLLDLLAAAAPGRAVEVRVPPYGAVQCVAGPTHTRGTPPNVVETDPVTWLRLATGGLPWWEGVERCVVRASGPRADLSPYLPIKR